jgi:hypothetical protein
MEDQKITVEQLLAKIGELTIKLDIAASQIAMLQDKISQIESLNKYQEKK